MRLLVYPEYLFYLLLKKYNPEMVLDVGSRDGRESMKFRDILSKSRIVAFEANPFNYDAMIRNEKLKNGSIEIVNNAASDQCGNIDFFRIETDEEWKSGASSIFSRAGDDDNEAISVPVTTLDEYFHTSEEIENFAIWVDVEGAAYNVVNGARDTLRKTLFAHIEVETDYIWENQRLKKDVDKVVLECGMIELARPLSSNRKKQFDVLYINKSIWDKNRAVNLYVVSIAVTMSVLRKIMPSKIKYGRFNLLAKMESIMIALV